MKKRTRQEAKRWLSDQNLTVAEWARQNGYTSTEVYRVVNGHAKCLYGRGKEIAIKLNINLDSE